MLYVLPAEVLLIAFDSLWCFGRKSTFAECMHNRRKVEELGMQLRTVEHAHHLSQALQPRSVASPILARCLASMYRIIWGIRSSKPQFTSSIAFSFHDVAQHICTLGLVAGRRSILKDHAEELDFSGPL